MRSDAETCFNCGWDGPTEEIYPDRIYSEHREPICGDCWAAARMEAGLRSHWAVLVSSS